MNRSHRVGSEAHPHRTALSGSGLTTLWAPRPCWLWLAQGLTGNLGILLCKCVLLAVREWGLFAQRSPCILGLPCTGAGRRGKQACKLTTSDVLRGNRSSFLWIALSLTSLQINLVTAGDSAAATAGPFSAVSVVCARGSGFLPCAVFKLI